MDEPTARPEQHVPLCRQPSSERRVSRRVTGYQSLLVRSSWGQFDEPRPDPTADPAGPTTGTTRRRDLDPPHPARLSLHANGVARSTSGDGPAFRPGASVRTASAETTVSTRKRKPGAALAADCQKTVAECEYPRTATDRRYGLMADPKRVVERHVEAFNARDADADPWSDDADFVAPNASMQGREEVLASSVCSGTRFRTGVLRRRAFSPKDPSPPRGPVHRHAHRCHAHAGRRGRGHGTARRFPLDVELRGSRRRAGLGTSLLRSGRAARPARTDAGALSALLPCAKRAFRSRPRPLGTTSRSRGIPTTRSSSARGAAAPRTRLF